MMVNLSLWKLEKLIEFHAQCFSFGKKPPKNEKTVKMKKGQKKEDKQNNEKERKGK